MFVYDMHERALSVDSKRPYVIPHVPLNMHLSSVPRVCMHQTIPSYCRRSFQFCFFETHVGPNFTRCIIFARFWIGMLNSSCYLFDICCAFLASTSLSARLRLFYVLVLRLSHPWPSAVYWMSYDCFNNVCEYT